MPSNSIIVNWKTTNLIRINVTKYCKKCRRHLICSIMNFKQKQIKSQTKTNKKFKKKNCHSDKLLGFVE